MKYIYISAIGLGLSLALILASVWINVADRQNFEDCLFNKGTGNFYWNGVAGGLSYILIVIAISLLIIFALQIGYYSKKQKQ